MAEVYLRGKALWQQVRETTASALASGHLQTIPTDSIDIKDGPLDFQLRVVHNLERKTRAQLESITRTPEARNFSPFLTYEPALYVGELTPRYRCLLNKFNVQDQHIVLVTRQFAEQRESLDVEDFLAAAIALQARDGLVFYNGGTDAGASVRHKHLQMIPLPLCADRAFPFALQLAHSAPADGRPARCASWPFAHRLSRASYGPSLEQTAEDNLARYRAQLRELGLAPVNDLMPPHNMLLTREHLWVVPRRRGTHQGLAVNALGFAGTLLVKNRELLTELQRLGPASWLVQVTSGE